MEAGEFCILNNLKEIMHIKWIVFLSILLAACEELSELRLYPCVHFQQTLVLKIEIVRK